MHPGAGKPPHPPVTYSPYPLSTQESPLTPSPSIHDRLKKNLLTSIRKGFVLNMDPDFLLRTYGDIVVGRTPGSCTIGQRYALCIGVVGYATFWVMLTSQWSNHVVEIPTSAKEGAWTDNGCTSYFKPDQIYVMTREMAVEAFLFGNRVLRSDMKWSYVAVEKITAWPEIPTVYAQPTGVKLPQVAASAVAVAVAGAALAPMPPLHVNTPTTDRLSKVLFGVALTTLVAGDSIQLIQAPTPEPFNPVQWLRACRIAAGYSQATLAEAMDSPYVSTQTIHALEKGLRKFEPAELDMWAFLVKVEGDPRLAQVPVLTEDEQKIRNSIRAGRQKASEADPEPATPKQPQEAPAPKPTIPQETPVMTHPKTPQPKAAPALPTPLPRAEVIARASAILAYHRISDLESEQLLLQLETSFRELLAHDPALAFLTQRT